MDVMDDLDELINDVSEEKIDADKRHRELVMVLRKVITAVEGNKVDIKFPDLSPIISANNGALEQYLEKLKPSDYSGMVQQLTVITARLVTMNDNFIKLAEKLDLLNQKLSERPQWTHKVERNSSGTIDSITSIRK